MPAPTCQWWPIIGGLPLVVHDDLANDDPASRHDMNPTDTARFQLWLASPQGLRHFDPAILTGSDRRRFDSLRNPRQREQFALSRALLAHAAVPAASSLSLSHSGDYAALASGPAGYSIGVDLEQHRARDIVSIAQFAFSDAESSALLALASPQRERLFYLLWVMKEALAKALQLPLLEALRSCAFHQQDHNWSAAVPTQRRWSVLAFVPRPGVSLAIACVAGENMDPARTGPGITGPGIVCPGMDVETRKWPLTPADPHQRDGTNWPRLATITSPAPCHHFGR